MTDKTITNKETKKIGRPKKAESELLIRKTIRLTQANWDKLKNHENVKKLRQFIDSQL